MSQTRYYNALLAVENISSLLEYYKLFQYYKQHNKNDFQVAAIFSAKPDFNEDDLSSDRAKALENIIKDNYKDVKIDNYHNKVLSEMKKNHIDILIVVRMFLTGFDSPLLNALYVDKVLQKHDLFQSFSRTIRKHNNYKKVGNIYCFQTSESEVNKSLRLFTKENIQDSNSSLLQVSPYEEVVKEYNNIVYELKQLANTPEEVDNFKNQVSKETKYLNIFTKLSQKLSQLTLNSEEDEFKSYKAKYNRIKNKRRGQTKGGPGNGGNDDDYEVEFNKNILVDRDYIGLLFRDYK
ncbi:MAG: type I restriction endonuclease subunit R, EcoR124 family [Candidatus Phytoplasma sp. TWB_XP]